MVLTRDSAGCADVLARAELPSTGDVTSPETGEPPGQSRAAEAVARAHQAITRTQHQHAQVAHREDLTRWRVTARHARSRRCPPHRGRTREPPEETPCPLSSTNHPAAPHWRPPPPSQRTHPAGLTRPRGWVREHQGGAMTPTGADPGGALGRELKRLARHVATIDTRTNELAELLAATRHRRRHLPHPHRTRRGRHGPGVAAHRGPRASPHRPHRPHHLARPV